MRTVVFINMSNGVFKLSDALVEAEDKGAILLKAGEATTAVRIEDVRIMRLPSSWCERKMWTELVQGSSDEFLLNLAVGNTCWVLDCGAHHAVPRACWQGVEWLRFALTEAITGNTAELPIGRAHQCGAMFYQAYRDLPKSAKKKLKYYAQFAVAGWAANIVYCCSQTRHDGNYTLLKNITRALLT
jgi:hypothetical protein